MIDYSKYKRVFAFGCSFTSYSFPTWADLIAKEMSHAEYYNFGTSGSGNLLISNRVAQANCQFNFCETDLVLVMFTTAYREDRYIDGVWITKGNVFNQDFYDKNFIKNYCDPDGYMIRDLGLIELTRGYLSNLDCTTVYMSIGDLSSESRDLRPTHDPKTQHFNDRLNNLYKNTCDNILPSVESIVGNPKVYHWINKDGGPHDEGHPGTLNYSEYLQAVGIPLSESTLAYARECQEKIENIKYAAHLEIVFPEINARKTLYECNMI